jgi:tRNA(Ser,Leu) C12 N-acetylase TAN1
MIIQIDKKTAEKIKSFKITERESYDSILNRILKNVKKNEERNKTF